MGVRQETPVPGSVFASGRLQCACHREWFTLAGGPMPKYLARDSVHLTVDFFMPADMLADLV